MKSSYPERAFPIEETFPGDLLPICFLWEIRRAFEFATSPEKYGAPDRIRTCDLWNRNPTLYPAELRVHA